MTLTTIKRSTRTRTGRRTILGSVAALAAGAGLAASGVVAASADADAPTRTHIDTTDAPTVATVDDICPFPVTSSGVQIGTLLDFTDASGAGNLIFTGTETDTFWGPAGPGGPVLHGTPYHGSVHATVDSQGNFTRLFGAGVAEVVPLNNGSTFHAAGRVDFLKRFQDGFVIVPDSGVSHNLAEFCRELAP